MLLNKKVRKRLIDLNLTMTDLGKIISLSREHVSRVILGRTKSQRAKILISEALGCEPEKIWDNWKTSKS